MLKKLERFFFFLTILFLPTQLGRHFWPKFSFLYSLPIDYLSPTVYFWDLLALVLVIIFLLTKSRINRLALNLLLLFLLSQSATLLYHLGDSLALGRGLVRLEQYFIAGLFGVYLSSQNWQKLKKSLTSPLLFAMAFESLLATAQLIKGGTLGFWILGERSFTLTTPGVAKFNFKGLEFLRPYATFPHPNVLAAFLLISQILISALDGFKSFFAKVVVSFSMVGLFLTMSRTVILAGFLSMFVLIKGRWLVISALILIALSPVFLVRFGSLLSFDSLSLVRREELNFAAWELFLKSPLFGMGLNSYIPSASANLVAGPSRFLQPTHNIFLLEIAETGLVGLFGLGLLILGAARSLIGFYGKNIKIPLLLIWLVILFLGCFDHFFLTLPQGYRLLFLVWGLSLAEKNS